MRVLIQNLLLLCVSLNGVSSLKGQEAKPEKKEPTQGPIDPKAGTAMEWEGWSFRWQVRDIEGLMLSDVFYQGKKVLKSINLAEIYVPYGTGWPRPEDFSLGGFVGNPMPLELGRDCYGAAGNCRAFHRDGRPSKGPTADLMIHEEPTGFLYAGKLGRAPGKMLVLWSMAHFPGVDDGYTYVLRWKLRSDGSLCAEVGATGGLQHLNVGVETGRGHFVGKDPVGEFVFAPSHVHNYYFRIDFDIDGADGNVAEEFTYENDPADSMLSAAVWRPFEFERGRVQKEDVFRSWRVKNPKSLNSMGHPRSYHLIPGGNGAWKDGSAMPMLKGDFFVTKYRESEFPYSTSDHRKMLEALNGYLNEEKLMETDLVAWYRLSFVHHPRTEDWMAQPIVWNSFELMPRDFLDGSPLTATK